MRHYKTLTWDDRLKIAAWQKVGISPQRMAEELGVHFTTIYRELKRGRYEHLNTNYTTEVRYSPDISEKKKQDYLRAKGAGLKIGNDRAYAEYIEYMIRIEKYSPAAVLGEIKTKGIEFKTTVCKQTLYRYIDQGVFLTLTNQDLPVKRNKKEHKHKKVRAAKPPAWHKHRKTSRGNQCTHFVRSLGNGLCGGRKRYERHSSCINGTPYTL